MAKEILTPALDDMIDITDLSADARSELDALKKKIKDLAMIICSETGCSENSPEELDPDDLELYESLITIEVE